MKPLAGPSHSLFNERMKLDTIRITEAPGEYESLAMSLRAVAEAAGGRLDYDAVCAALGVSFTAVSTVSDSAPGWWMTYGRDAFLEPTARLFGLELRDLHPPDVAVDMVSAEEFGQHFELSYAPLIRRAIENAQPVIAWQGWPDHAGFFWGVITAATDTGFTGVSIWTGGRVLPLATPALQCYVVERCEPQVPARDLLLRTALAHADAFMNRAPFEPVDASAHPPIVTGPAAFDAWEQWLSSLGEQPGPELWNEHRQHAEFLAAARESCARFLSAMQEVVSAEQFPLLQEAIACAREVATHLAESRDAGSVQSLLGTRQGRERAYGSVTAAEAADRRLAMRVEELHGTLRQASGSAPRSE